jgi:hypothetical protein
MAISFMVYALFRRDQRATAEPPPRPLLHVQL